METKTARKEKIVGSFATVGAVLAIAFLAAATEADERQVREALKDAPEIRHELIRAQAYKNECATLNPELSKPCDKVRAVMEKSHYLLER